MNAVTQCPACGTLFRVVDDQLRISQGWVRCGQCHEVFNAQLSLSSESAMQELPAPQSADSGSAAAPDDAVGWTAQPFAEPSIQPVPDVAEPMNVVHAQTEPTGSEAATATPTDAAADPSPAFPVPDAALAQAAPSFMAARAEAKQKRPWLTSMLWALSLLFAAALAFQTAWFFRDRLAAYFPQLQPLLSSACAALGCRINPLMQLDAWVLDDVAVSPVTGAHRLSLSLRNGAAVALAVPAIELSLQDANDKLVLRRVLTPAEMNIDRPSLKAGEEFNVSVSMALRDANGQPFKRIAGYRVVAFYP